MTQRPPAWTGRVPGALALALEASAVAVLASGRPAGLPLGAGLHLVAASLAARGLAPPLRDARFLVFALVLAVPVAGLLGLIALRLWNLIRPPAARPGHLHAGGEDLPGPEQAPGSLDSVFQWVQSQLSVQPLGDAIRSGDAGMQRWAIRMLSRRADGAAVELLREALLAQERDIQIAASSAIQRIEERLTSHIAQARERTTREPASAEGWIELGDACRTYEQSYLLEPVMQRHWLRQAEAAYRAALVLEASSAPAGIALARVLLGLGSVDDAAGLARRLAGSTPSAETDLLLAEVLFAQEQWLALREACRAAVVAGRATDLLAWWSGADRADAA